MRRIDVEIGVDEEQIINEANEGAVNLLDEGIRQLEMFGKAGGVDDRYRLVVRDCQILIAGFMTASAIMYGANMIAAAILAVGDKR